MAKNKKLTDKEIARIIRVIFSDDDGYLNQDYFEKCLDALGYNCVRETIDEQVSWLNEKAIAGQEYDSIVRMIKAERTTAPEKEEVLAEYTDDKNIRLIFPATREIMEFSADQDWKKVISRKAFKHHSVSSMSKAIRLLFRRP